MTRLQRIAAATAVIGALGVSATIDARQRGVSNAVASAGANVTGEVLRRTSTANDAMPGSWLSYGRDQSETRYSTLKQINTSNAHRLGLAWSYVMGAGGSNQEGTPLMWNNTLYGITAWSVVFALDARTGREIWRWDPQIDQPATRSAICCGIVNRGVAIYNGTIIAPSIAGRLFALDARSGKPVWETRLVDSKELLTLTMAPRVAGGKVIIGAAGGDRPTRGSFFAVDAQTGKLAW
ncbi:MAG TPA: PQQ-binding-like beta-propeller repeat protein, partial [Vicinamibacterales bacterium]|nr:PQQ-binding-like beta-propeller repeat protein [Vicinamibacterales bacterium]